MPPISVFQSSLSRSLGGRSSRKPRQVTSKQYGSPKLTMDSSQKPLRSTYGPEDLLTAKSLILHSLQHGLGGSSKKSYSMCFRFSFVDSVVSSQVCETSAGSSLNLIIPHTEPSMIRLHDRLFITVSTAPEPIISLHHYICSFCWAGVRAKLGLAPLRPKGRKLSCCRPSRALSQAR